MTPTHHLKRQKHYQQKKYRKNVRKTLIMVETDVNTIVKSINRYINTQLKAREISADNPPFFSTVNIHCS